MLLWSFATFYAILNNKFLISTIIKTCCNTDTNYINNAPIYIKKHCSSQHLVSTNFNTINWNRQFISHKFNTFLQLLLNSRFNQLSFYLDTMLPLFSLVRLVNIFNAVNNCARKWLCNFYVWCQTLYFSRTFLIIDLVCFRLYTDKRPFISWVLCAQTSNHG